MLFYIRSFICALCLCFLLTYAVAQSSDTKPGNEILIRSTNQTNDVCNKTLANQNVQCSDCNNLVYCKTNLTIKCPTTRPYCDNSKCVAEMPEKCEVQSGLNVCPLGSDNKYYPDPSTCYKYYYCDDNQEALEAYECPTGFPFDYSSQACTRGKPCGSFNCFNKIFALYSTSSTLGVICSENKIIEGSYVACQKSQQLDESLTCTAVCSAEGNIPHETDKTKYYRCLASGPWGAFVKTEMRCPRNLTFDEDLGKCDGF